MRRSSSLNRDLKNDSTKKKTKKSDSSRRSPSGSGKRSLSLPRSKRSLSDLSGSVSDVHTPQSLRSASTSRKSPAPHTTANHYADTAIRLKKREEDLRIREEQLEAKLSEITSTEAHWVQLTQALREEHSVAMKQWEEMSVSVNKTQEEIGKAKRKEIADLTAKLEEERGKLREREQELSQHRVSAAGIESQLRSIRQANDDTNAENDRLRMEVANLKNIISQRDKDVETIRRGDELEFNSQITNFQKQISILTERISQKEEERQHQVDRYINIKKRYKAKRKQFEELKRVNTEQADEITRLKVLKQGLEMTKSHHVELLKQAAVDRQTEVENMQENILRLSQQFQLVQKDNSSHYSTPRRRVHSASRATSRWSSSSPPPQIVPFCSAVRPSSPPLALLDNGPTRYSYSRDVPRISHSFRWIPPPKSYDINGNTAQGQRTYAQRNPAVSNPPPKKHPKDRSKRSTSVDTNETYGAMPLHEEKTDGNNSNNNNNNSSTNNATANNESTTPQVPPPSPKDGVAIDPKTTKNEIERTQPQNGVPQEDKDHTNEAKEKHAVIVTPQHSGGQRSPPQRSHRSASNASSHSRGSGVPPSPAESPKALSATESFRTKGSSPETHDTRITDTHDRSEYSSICSSDIYSHASPTRTYATTASEASHVFNELTSSQSDSDSSDFGSSLQLTRLN